MYRVFGRDKEWMQLIIMYDVPPNSVAIMKKLLKIEASLYTILQVLSVTIFELMSLLQALTGLDDRSESDQNHNQLILFG
jgi:hypothetical protein